MSSFFPALQNHLLTKLLLVSVLLLLAAMAAMFAARERHEETRVEPPVREVPLFITGGTQSGSTHAVD